MRLFFGKKIDGGRAIIIDFKAFLRHVTAVSDELTRRH